MATNVGTKPEVGRVEPHGGEALPRGVHLVPPQEDLYQVGPVAGRFPPMLLTATADRRLLDVAAQEGNGAIAPRGREGGLTMLTDAIATP